MDVGLFLKLKSYVEGHISKTAYYANVPRCFCVKKIVTQLSNDDTVKQWTGLRRGHKFIKYSVQRSITTLEFVLIVTSCCYVFDKNSSTLIRLFYNVYMLNDWHCILSNHWYWKCYHPTLIH